MENFDLKIIMPILLVLILSQQLAIILQVINKFKKINTYFFDAIEVNSSNEKFLLKGSIINAILIALALIFYFAINKVSAIFILIFVIHLAYMKSQLNKNKI